MSNQQRPYLWVEFAKTGPMRYLSHLEVMRVFDRAVRRARIAVDYTQGYHPRAKISFAPPLPVGAEGLKELCEIDLATEKSANELGKALSRQLPAGLDLVSAQVRRRDRHSPFAKLDRAEYRLDVEIVGGTPQQLQAAVQQFRGAEQITVQRKTKRRTQTIDIRPHTYELRLEHRDSSMCLFIDVGFGEDNLVKPEEVITTLSQMMGHIDLLVGRVTRLKMYMI